ncbi:MAG: hypothetical protein H6581_12235 [Bacteroidia bacterium]|nr:hypothetical protein [Bacteroidia bacterium]
MENSKNPRHISEILQSMFADLKSAPVREEKSEAGQPRFRQASVEVSRPQVSATFFPGLHSSSRF